MKYSKQRELIKEKVMDNREHLTADDVYMMVKSEMPNISLATVYRNLNILAESGVVTKVPFPNASDRYDGYTTEHYHMVCNKCSCIFDVELEILSEIPDKIREKMGFMITQKQFFAIGVCKQCSE